MIRTMVDRWRRGPALRAALAEADLLRSQLIERGQQVLGLQEKLTEVLHQAAVHAERTRLYSELLHGGHVKLRCLGGCGEWKSKAALALLTEERDGLLALKPTCEDCLRRRAREQAQQAALVAATAESGDPEAPASDPLVASSGSGGV